MQSDISKIYGESDPPSAPPVDGGRSVAAHVRCRQAAKKNRSPVEQLARSLDRQLNHVKAADCNTNKKRRFPEMNVECGRPNDTLADPVVLGDVLLCHVVTVRQLDQFTKRK